MIFYPSVSGGGYIGFGTVVMSSIAPEGPAFKLSAAGRKERSKSGPGAEEGGWTTFGRGPRWRRDDIIDEKYEQKKRQKIAANEASWRVGCQKQTLKWVLPGFEVGARAGELFFLLRPY